MKKKYQIIRAYADNASVAERVLEGQINELLSSGWELVGGVSTMYDPDHESYHFTQAIVKVEG